MAMVSLVSMLCVTTKIQTAIGPVNIATPHAHAPATSASSGLATTEGLALLVFLTFDIFSNHSLVKI